MAVTKEQEKILQRTMLLNGRNAWEYVNLFAEDKRPWVAKGIISCIEQHTDLRPDSISTEAGKLKYKDVEFRPTERQLEMVPYPDFWEMQERGRRFQEFLPPYSLEDAIREMKARGQYRTTGWIL